MNIPNPAEMTVRDWNNYVVAQLSQAALGLIPPHAVALGIAPGDEEVVVHFQLTEVDARDREDMYDIASELGDLMCDVVGVRTTYEVRDRPVLSPADGVHWVYRSRTEDNDASTSENESR